MKNYQELQTEASLAVRRELKSGLLLCTEAQQHFFKRLYSGGDLTLTLKTVIAGMTDRELKGAMQQVQRTLEKNAKRETDDGE